MIQVWGGASSAKQHDSADSSTESLHPLSDEHRDFIQKSLDDWCANSGYKDCNVNMLTLSRTLSIPKDELSVYFDQYLKTTFRIWLGDIRFNAAKKMILECPDYSNDIVSAECGSQPEPIYTAFSRQRKVVLLPNGGRKWLKIIRIE